MDRERIALTSVVRWHRARRPTARSPPVSPASSRTTASPSSIRSRPTPCWTSTSTELLEEYVNDPERSDGKAVGDPIAFEFNTTNDPFNVETNQLVASMWEEAFGDLIDVTITPIEQGSYVSLGVTGNYMVQGWARVMPARRHRPRPSQLRFWVSSTVAPVDSPTFNFGRFHFPELDALAEASRAEDRSGCADRHLRGHEPPVRRAGLLSADDRPGHTLWGIVAGDYVQDIAPLPLPDGGETFPVISGSHAVTQLWCTEGVCE